ncbi:hypothetical protein ACLB2K_006027 [Fragaria x ananassa]
MEDIWFYTSLSLIFLLFTFKSLFQPQHRRYKNLPPTPSSLPILGHLHLLKPPVHRTFHCLSQTYGPIFSLWFGSRRVVIVSSPSAVEECFTKNDIVLANRPRLLLGKYIGYNWSTDSSSNYGDHWRNLRRIGAVEIFSSQRLNMFSDIRKVEVKHLVRMLARNSSSGDFSKVEMKSMFNELTFNIIMTMVAGKRYYGDGVDVSDKEEAKQFREIMREAFAYGGAANQADFLPILNWIGAGGIKRSIPSLGSRNPFTTANVLEGVKSFGPSSGSGIKSFGPSLGLGNRVIHDETLKGLKSSGSSPGLTHSFTTVDTLKGTKSSGPSPGLGNRVIHGETLKEIKRSGRSPGLTHSFITIDILKGIKSFGLSLGPGNRVTHGETLKGKKLSGPSPGIKHSGPSPGLTHSFTTVDILKRIKSSSPSPGSGNRVIDAKTFKGIKRSGHSPGLGNPFTTTNILEGIKSSDPSPTLGNRVIDAGKLKGIKQSSPSPGVGHSFTTSDILKGIKSSGPSPGSGNKVIDAKTLKRIKRSGPNTGSRNRFTTANILEGIKN